MKKYTIISLSILSVLLLAHCKSQSDLTQNGRLNVINYNNPLVVGEFSEVAELVLNLDRPQFIRELSFDLNSADTLESLRVFQLVNTGADQEKLPIAAIKDVVGSNVVYLDRQLEAGEHRFFVSVFPKDNPSSSNVRINFNHISSDKNKFVLVRD